MNRNYKTMEAIDLTKEELKKWAEAFEAHEAIALAIHVVAEMAGQPPIEVWENPTRTEVNHVEMAVEEYLRKGDFIPEEDGIYQWGLETIEVQLIDINKTAEEEL